MSNIIPTSTAMNEAVKSLIEANELKDFRAAEIYPNINIVRQNNLIAFKTRIRLSDGDKWYLVPVCNVYDLNDCNDNEDVVIKHFHVVVYQYLILADIESLKELPYVTLDSDQIDEKERLTYGR